MVLVQRLFVNNLTYPPLYSKKVNIYQTNSCIGFAKNKKPLINTIFDIMKSI